MTYINPIHSPASCREDPLPGPVLRLHCLLIRLENRRLHCRTNGGRAIWTCLPRRAHRVIDRGTGEKQDSSRDTHVCKSDSSSFCGVQRSRAKCERLCKPTCDLQPGGVVSVPISVIQRNGSPDHAVGACTQFYWKMVAQQLRWGREYPEQHVRRDWTSRKVRLLGCMRDRQCLSRRHNPP